MNTSKIIKGVVGGGRYTVTAPIIKEDYGLYLRESIGAFPDMTPVPEPTEPEEVTEE